ncbi:MAG TPA: PP2C family serine/threonine-protein phosphatase [bacterium]|nr:PP2C family serine/threonine-protein phosphatase [bacterium]
MSSAVTGGCVIRPAPALDADISPFCSIQGGGSPGGGGASVWRFRSAGLTDVGCVRLKNEDAFSLRPDRGLYVVADGMGGHRGGEVASRMAVDGVEDFTQILPSMTSEERLEALAGAFRLCCSQVFERGVSDLDLRHMGTTLLALHLDETAGRYSIAHVGDSRAYRIREKRMEQLTEDHSLRNEAKNMGAPEAQWSLVPKSIITRSIGTFETVRVDTLSGELQPEDVFLLCTDGLTDALRNDAILGVILAHQDLQEACRELIRRANEGGGPDNITAVLVRAMRPA